MIYLEKGENKLFLKKVLLVASLSIFIFAFQNCGRVDKGETQNKASSSPNSKVSFQWINANIIQPKCVSCHNEQFAFSGLLMTSHENVLKSIEPGKPEESSFYTRSFSTTFFTLTSEEQEIIYEWILDGAKNN